MRVIIDDKELILKEGEKLNGIEAARRVGIHIPHYCYHPALSVVGSCRMCLVEYGMQDPNSGELLGRKKLLPACKLEMTDGSVITTDSERVRAARARVEEGLLLRHPIDCPVCDKAGECLLQDYHFEHGQKERRADVRPFTSRKHDLGDKIRLFVDRCVMCSRCVRFTREIAGDATLMVKNRGSHSEIDIFPGHPIEGPMSCNVVDLCPVGALADKEFLYKQRVWFMKSRPSICAACSAGCSIWIDENQGHIWRIRPRENQATNRWWICDAGRHSFGYVHSPNRLTSPMRRNERGATNIDWSVALEEIVQKFTDAGRPAAVLSPMMTIEEAELAARWIRTFDPAAPLALGPVPREGEDQTFPGASQNAGASPAANVGGDFTIRAEKCPNRRGVEKVLTKWCGRVTSFDEFLEELPGNQVDALWVAAGYPHDWITKDQAARLTNLQTLVVHDLFPTPLSEVAHYVLPSAAWAERSGTFINATDHPQTFEATIRPLTGIRADGSLYWRLLGKKGLYRSEEVLKELKLS